MISIFIKKIKKGRVGSGVLNWFNGPPTDPTRSHGFQRTNCISGL